MIISKKLLGIALAIFAVSSVQAHDSIVDPSRAAGTSAGQNGEPVLTEGQAGYFSHVVGHGCANSAGVYSGVIGASVLFPYAANSKAVYTNASGTTMTGVLSDHLSTTLFGGVSLTGGSTIWPKYSYHTATVSGATKQVGWKFYGGTSYTSTDGVIKDRALVPFYVAAQTFQAASCASQVVFHLAAANYCQNTNSVTKGYANVWLPAATNPGIRTQYSALEIGDASSFVVKLNRSTTAYPAACADATQRYTVHVYPSDADLDKYLPQTIPSP